MNNCSEYVGSGHPDKVADLVASYLLDAYIRHDPKTRFALEVQLKDHICNLAGEVTSTWRPNDDEIAELARAAIRKVGYTAEYAARWPVGATLNADKVVVNNYIGRQSPDIAQGVDREGWGDQGIMEGMATPEAEYGYMPRDRHFAHEIGKKLYRAALRGDAPIGLDIKVLVSLNPAAVEQVVIAAPMLSENEPSAKTYIERIVRETLSGHNYKMCDELIINGTGAYVIHSSVGDAGVVGRKLAVDFYGLNCPIGGGSPNGKDGTKADVTLNLYARYLSLVTVLKNPGKFKTVYTKIGCCIGQSRCRIAQFDGNYRLLNEHQRDIIPSAAIRLFGLDGRVRKDMFFHMCRDGLFSYVDEVAAQNNGITLRAGDGHNTDS